MAISQEKTTSIRRLIVLLASNKSVLGILLLVGIFRFWNVSKYFIFDLDVQYQALLAWEQIKNFHIIWIGVSASNLGYYLGPGLVYLTALLLKISQGDPIILGYFASCIGIITAVSLYVICKVLFDKKIALISLVLYGFSHFMIAYDRKYWPLFIPLIALWLFFSVVQSRKNPMWLILSIILIATSYHIHLSLLIFWPFIIVALYRSRKKIPFRMWGIMAASYLMITSPLLVFDFVHNFDNMLLPLKLLSSKSNEYSGNFHILNSFNYLNGLTSQILVSKQFSTLVSFIVFFMLLLQLGCKFHNWKKSSEATRYLLAIIITLFLAVLFYPGPLQQYYGVLFAPFIFLLLALGISGWQPQYRYLTLAIFIVINCISFLRQPSYNGLSAKKKFIENLTSEIGNETYYLSFEEDRDYQGWRYLFQQYGRIPASSKSDEMFGWIYMPQIKSTHQVTVFIGQKPPEKYEKIIVEGPFTGFISRP